MKEPNYDQKTEFFNIKGQVIKSIVNDDRNIEINTEQETFALYHLQDCCEYVKLYRIIGDISSLIDTKITLAEDETKNTHPEWYKKPKYEESYTWSCFYLENEYGDRVEFYFLGESNGYYREEVECFQVN